ncbi:MAG TPA: 50S ribosomal protein L25 [Dehalococcoidia bacterium]|nr:50S ribosomal protein L25 [Dehalococcoidia bacterium]
MTTQAFKLVLDPRATRGKKVKQLRKTGVIPVHLYGPETESRSLQCTQRDVLRALSRTGGTTPISVTVNGESGEYLTFAREVQWHPVRGDILHVDFMAVRATQRLTAQVPISLVGESPGARGAGGSVIQQLRELTVEALPLELPSEVQVNLGILTDPAGVIRAGDIPLPPNVLLLTDAEDVVVRIEALRAEEVVEAAGGGPAEPEVGRPDGGTGEGAE